MPSRRSNLARVQHLYSILEDNGECVYCGDPADTYDHFLPVSIAVGLREDVAVGRHFMLPACRSCNSTAGAEVFRSIGAKRRYVQERLRIANWKLLAMPDWTEDELGELGPGMRGQVLAAIRRKRWLEGRIRRKNLLSIVTVKRVERAMSSIVDGSAFVQQDAGISGITMQKPKRIVTQWHKPLVKEHLIPEKYREIIKKRIEDLEIQDLITRYCK